MKYSTVLSSLCLFLVMSSLDTLAAGNNSDGANKQQQPQTEELSYMATSRVDIQAEGFSLSAEKGSLTHALKMSVTVLPQQSSKLPYNLTNVTEQGNVIRLLPSGEHFKTDRPARITLSYDPKLIPAGYTASNIYTFCRDEDSSEWKRLERVSVDTVQHTITSLTTHFSDFTNAVIKVPEMPESSAFVPTDMQNLPDPDPLVGIPMVAVPQANNKGTAELTYPIQLPPGRHGLQPDLDLHYSSATTNGLLGVGWSIAQPAVTIDTRWGVPRYELGYETEAYLINGEPFLMHDQNNEPIPLPHMASSFEPRRTKATRFYARDQRNQNKAVRHGQNPGNYWWSVTTTDGVTYYYGYDPYGHAIDENSILRTKEGNIGYWALTYVVDRFDNYVRYINYKHSDNEIVIERIEYTGNYLQNLQPYYKVVFTYKLRPDKMMDARLGLLRNQNHLLCQIYVLLDTETIPITTYRLYYEEGAFSLHKSRLKSIAKVDGGFTYLGECDMPMENTLFELSDEQWIEQEDVLYSEITKECISNEQKPGCLTQFSYGNAFASSSLFKMPAQLVSSTANFSASRTEGWNVGGDVAIGFGFNPAMTTFSAGANYSYTRSEGGVETMMIDLNGDGLLDRLHVSGQTVEYMRQKNDSTFESPVVIQGLNGLSREISSSHTFGLQLDFGANLSYSPVISNSYTDVYFSDINGDGLPDLVTPEGVRMNSLDSANIPTFSPIADNVQGIEVNGNNCSKSITFNGHVDERLMCELNYICIDTLFISDLQPSDDGESDFIEVHMSQDEAEPEGEGYLEPDIWNPLPIHERGEAKEQEMKEIPYFSMENIENDTPFSQSRQPNSHAVKSETSVSWAEILDTYYQGEDYSFRLVHDTIYVYHKEFICTKTSDEPNVDIIRVWVSDRTATLRIGSVASLVQDTSFSRTQAREVDGVRLRIQWNKGVHQQGKQLIADTALMLYDKTIEADDYVPDTMLRTITIQQGDILFFRLSALTNHRFDNVNWEQTVLSLSGDTIFNSARNYLCTGEQAFIAPASGTARIVLSCANEDTVPARVIAKLDGTQILNRTLPAHAALDTLFYANVIDSSRIAFSADYFSVEPQWSKVKIFPSVDYWGSLVVDTAGTGTTLPDTLHYSPDVQLQHTSFYPIDTCLYRRLFGPLHKGWGWFAYNDINRDSIIPLPILRNEEDRMADSVYNNMQSYQNDNAYTTLHDPSLSDSLRQAKADSCFSAVPTYSPLSDDKRWVAMHADYPNNKYLAYGNTGAIGQRLHSVSRQLSNVVDSSVVRETINEYDSPIPTLHDNMQRITTIRKSTHAVQHGLTYGLSSPIGIGVSENASYGTYHVTSDYMDLNGDGYPDFVGNSAIQYTMPWGGIGSLDGQLPASFANTNSSMGLGFSASRPRPEHIPSNIVKDSKMAFGGFGGGLNGQLGTDETQTSLIDINADGLPDLVDAPNQRVKYNLGYSFTDEWYALAGLSIAASSHMDASISLSGNANFEHIWDVIDLGYGKTDYSLAQYSISGGISSSTSQNQSNIRLLDINGDSYLDLVTDDGYGLVQVRYYDGSSYGTPETLNVQSLQTSSTANIGFNLGVTGGFSLFLIPIKFCFGAQSSPWNVSASYGNTDFMDVNGDGYLDQIIAYNDTIKVRYNKNGSQAVNLLTEVTNPTGHHFSISYALSEPSVNHRARNWNVVDIKEETNPGLDASSGHYYNFSYDVPFYDTFERTDYGYARVQTIDNHTYTLEEEYENTFFINRGEKISDLLINENNHPIIGHRHEIRYYDSLDVSQTDVCNDMVLHIGKDGYWTDYYETEPTPQISTRYEKFYDAHHNLIHYVDYGDVAVNGDEWIQDIGYKATTSYNLISLPNFELIRNGSQILRQNRVKYDSLGRAFQIIKDDLTQNISAITALQYDAYGNIYQFRSPRNENHEWAWRRFTYDNETKTYVKSMFNQFAEYYSYKYDMRFGKRTTYIDPTGNAMQWRYDRMGRLIDIVAPNEDFNHNPFSVHYIYRQPFHDFSNNNNNTLLYPHVTKVAADTALVSVDETIYDARGHAHQRKSWRYVNGHYKWVTDGWRMHDAWYRPTKTYDPYITDISLHSLWEPDTTSHLPHATDYQYDALNRITYLMHPDSTDSRTTYHFAYDSNGDKRLLINNTDEDSVIRHTLQAPQGWTIETKNLMDNSHTLFDYNPIGELIGVTDADNYLTKYDYDMFGNKICSIHPDAGKTYWNYAPDGSLMSIKTARMSGAGDSIHYVYCFDKLTDIQYPRTPLNDVHLQYDSAGRMAYYEDGIGSTRLYYDRMGNIRTSHRRIVVPTESNVYTFRTRFTYDSFGRIRNIIYPDGDHVTYRYYESGELRDVSRSPLLGPSMPIVSGLQYDEQGRNIHRTYGNNVWTSYQYEPLRNRLTRMQTESPLCDLQNLDYWYDGVSNIIRMEQSYPDCGGMGGAYINEYTYDYQNRLIRAISPYNPFAYDFQADYSHAGRFGHDFCSAISTEDALYGYDKQHMTHQPRVIFDQENKKHTQLFWDANGNMSQLIECNSGFVRFHDWDDENRLRMALDTVRAGFYGYDANGERVYKLTGISTITHINNDLSSAYVKIDTAILYPDPYVTITPKEYTKHYYANGERLATSIGAGGWCHMTQEAISSPDTDHEIYLQAEWKKIYNKEYPFEYPHEDHPALTDNEDISGNTPDELQYVCPMRHLTNLEVDITPDILWTVMHDNCDVQSAEDDIFYRHSDHLGSASWITEHHGDAIQYLHYLPYGQLLANQMPYGYDERYKFTGKERDSETGYDYFGARYYAPQLLHWTTVDPLADKYPGISPYAYCSWNPIKFVDLDGRDVWELDGNGSVVNKITDKTQDAIRMNGKQISFESNSITSVNQDNYQTTLAFENEGVASNTFKFLADNSSVEYGLVNSTQKSTIVTQHNKGTVNTDGIIESAISNNEVINYIIHNHPKNSGPSGFSRGSTRGDKFALHKTQNMLGYSILAYVYQPAYNRLWPFSVSTMNDKGSIWKNPSIGTQSITSPSWRYRIKNFFGYKMKL